jgi:hypothetical protein
MSDTVFRFLLKLYPRRFRAEYGDAMRLLFHDRMHAETGFVGRLRLWMDILRDLVISAPREHQRSPRFAAAGSERYCISEEGLREMGRSHRRRALSVFVALAVGFLLASFGHANRWQTCVVYGIATVFAIVPLRNVERSKHHWRGYELILKEDCIQQIGHNGLTRKLQKAEIVSVFETGDLGLAIKGQDHRNSIWVPSVLSGYDDLRARLREWTPIEKPLLVENQQVPHSIVLNKWTVAIYPAALLVQSPYFAILLAALLGAYLLNSTRRFIVPGAWRGPTVRKMSMTIGLIAIVLNALLLLKVILVLR